MEDYVIKLVSMYINSRKINKDPEKWFFCRKGGIERKIYDVRDFIFYRLPEEIRTRQYKDHLLRTLSRDPRWNGVK